MSVSQVYCPTLPLVERLAVLRALIKKGKSK